jgi:hypothetical protein
MRLIFNVSALVVIGLIGLTVGTVSADDKNDSKSKTTAVLVPTTWAEGEIVSVNEESERLTLRVRQTSPVIINNNNGYPGAYGAMNGRNVYGRMGVLNPNNSTVGVKEDLKDYQITFAPEMKVRLMNAKQDSSKDAKDKSSAKKDAKEKDPDAKLGGAPGKKESLAKGQMVRIQVGRSKDSINQQNYAMVVYVVSEGK